VITRFVNRNFIDAELNGMEKLFQEPFIKKKSV